MIYENNNYYFIKIFRQQPQIAVGLYFTILILFHNYFIK